jgi:hypothetical protein
MNQKTVKNVFTVTEKYLYLIKNVLIVKRNKKEKDIY